MRLAGGLQHPGCSTGEGMVGWARRKGPPLAGTIPGPFLGNQPSRSTSMSGTTPRWDSRDVIIRLTARKVS